MNHDDLDWRRPAPSRAYAEVIGDPIAHSKSPLIHNYWLAKLGIDGEYRGAHVPAADLAEYFEARRADPNWRGCNVTIPHKQAGIEFIDGPLQEMAAQQIDAMLPGYPEIGAVNVIVPRDGSLFGANTDVDGIIGPINSFHDVAFNYGSVPPRSVVIIGAGGAARAAVAALKWRGWAGDWRIAVRRPETGEQLLADFGLAGKAVPIADDSFAGADILINASAMGMGEIADSPLTLQTMGSGTGQPLVFDMVYKPLETGLIRAAIRNGYAVIGGLDMLVGQAHAAFYHFFGAHPPSRGVDPDLRAILTA